MFNNNKKSHHFFTILILSGLVLTGGYLFSDYGKEEQKTDRSVHQPQNNLQQVYEPNTTPNENALDENSGQTDGYDASDIPNDDPLEEASEDGKYLIIEKNEKIVIYFIDDFGAKQFLQQTEIPYELLSENDQDMFYEGIELESLSEVYELLQDFES